VKVSLVSACLAAVCALDMLYTVWLVGAGAALEANPVMRFYMEIGMDAFIAVKAFFFLGPILVLEMLRRKRPHAVHRIIGAGLVLYPICLGVGILVANA